MAEHTGNVFPVALTAADDYSYEAVSAAVKRQFQLLALPASLRPGMRVTLKPNLLMKRAPERFTTTHPMLVYCVAQELRQLGIQNITVADSPGGPYTHAALEGIYQLTGMATVAAQTGALLNIDLESVQRTCPQGCMCASFQLIQPVVAADLVINLPKVKTHCMTTLSGGVKNLFGCVPGLQKPELHYRFPQERSFCAMLVDVAQTVAPAFTIADGIVSMEGDGPSGGSARHTGFLAGSRDPFCLDAVLARLLGLDHVSTVEISQERGLCPDGDQIPRLGDTLEPILNFKRPRSKNLDFLDRLPVFMQSAAGAVAKAVVSPRPVVDRRRCIGCGKCKESCPADTIRMQQKKAVILRENCIRCYCCQEMCPVQAIKIRRLGLFRL